MLVPNGVKAVSCVLGRNPQLLVLDTQLPPTVGQNNFATGVNDRGEIAYMDDVSAGGSVYALRRYVLPPTLVVCPPVWFGNPNYFTREIDNAGDIVGCVTKSDTESFPFASYGVRPATQTLGTPNPAGNPANQVAWDINDVGVSVGCFAALVVGTLAFVNPRGGARTDLNTIHPGPVVMQIAYAISNFDQIVGQASVANVGRAFYFTFAGGARNLGTLPGGGPSAAHDINDLGDCIVGQAEVANSNPFAVQRACLFSARGPVIDLNQQIAPNWHLWDAVAVNDSGVIVATGYKTKDGNPIEFESGTNKPIFHALLLNP